MSDRAMPPPLRADTAAARLLVIDDDLLMRGMAVRTLRQAGFHVVEAASGEEGLERFAAAPVDLVLLDVLMTGIDGFETCRRLRALERGRMVPVLMLTGLDEPGAVEQARAAGADDFVAKPVQWPLLHGRVAAALQAAAAPGWHAGRMQHLVVSAPHPGA